MPETSSWTPEEAHENIGFTGGRISLALIEVLRRLERDLPLLIAYENERQGWTGDQALKAPAGYHQAPESLTDDYINTVCVGVSVNKINQGTRQFRNEGALRVAIIHERIEIGQQVTKAWDKSDLAALALHKFKSGCVNPDGLWAWRQLAYLRQEALPADPGANYSGVVISYKVVQDPNDTFWL